MEVDRIIVAGGRDFNDKFLMALALERRIASGDEIVNGMCKTGADNLARQYAIHYNHPVKEFPPDWDRFKTAAGPMRNRQMAEYGNVLIAFWDGKSRGTKGMIDLALKNGCEVHVYRY